MANFYSGIVAGRDYVNLETAMGKQFTTGNEYTIQPNGSCYIREGTIGRGFYCKENEKVYFTKEDGVDLFICPLGLGNVYVNIGETVLVNEPTEEVE